MLQRQLFDQTFPDFTDLRTLVARDLNKYNVHIRDDRRSARLVDPVYLINDNPYQDLINIGHDMLMELPDGSEEADVVMELFMPNTSIILACWNR